MKCARLLHFILLPMVHRMTFHTIKQADTESLEDFLIHLQATSPDCEFNCLGCQYDLSNIYICDQFVRCLQNSLLQTDILTKASQLKTPADVVKHAKPIKAAIRDQSHLKNKHPLDTAFAAHQSTYQRQKNSNPYKPTPVKSKTCIGCSSTQHGQFERSVKCPAWGQKCKNCGIQNYYARVCLHHNDKSKVSDIYLIAHVKYDTTHDTYIPSEELQATIMAKLPNRGCSQKAQV